MPLTGNPLVIVLGPTAVGKTDFAIHLGLAIGGQVMNADSRQVYRLMDIGTAKPTREQQSALPHHLLDIVDPADNLSAAQYQQMAYSKIEELHQNQVVPILVGGTGQYISAVVEGWTIPAVPPNPALRDQLESLAQQNGSLALHAHLATLDPVAAARIDFRNVRRVIRAIEVCIETGVPITQLQQKRPPPYRILCYGLTLERDALYARADRRIDRMIQAGFIDEVRCLLDSGYAPSLPSMSGLGYRQLAACLNGEMSLQEALQKTKFATRDFIRRQYTWFKGHDINTQWLDSDRMDETQVVQQVKSWLHEGLVL